MVDFHNSISESWPHMGKGLASIAEHPFRSLKTLYGITDNKNHNPSRATTILPTRTINFRLILVCLAAASVGLPVAIVSIAKVLLLLGGGAILIFSKDRGLIGPEKPGHETTKFAILLALGAFAVSLAWTTAPMSEALGSLAKYGKLLMIPMIMALLRNRKEAIYALGTFALVQLFLVISSWMLFFHMPVPWATSPTVARLTYAVFSSYLDQGIMTTVFAALCWQFRGWIPVKFGARYAVLIAVIALLNVFIVLIGRTGHVIAIASISLAIMWELPRRYRLGIVLLPVALLLLVSAVVPKVQQRVEQVRLEVSGFSFDKGVSVDSGNSAGIRLHFWHRAVQSITEHPVSGAGIGSWSSEFNRLEKQKNASPESIAPMGNPHQEYLLWGVQLGIPGILLIVGIFIAIFRDTLDMDVLAARATQSVLLAFVIACLFNSVIYDALIGDFFCVTLGLLLALGSHPPEHITIKYPEPDRTV
ncbi:MAG: O-antigen ligase family protein [Pseudomonadota bacterium]